jgi:hypothetical protein
VYVPYNIGVGKMCVGGEVAHYSTVVLLLREEGPSRVPQRDRRRGGL